MKSIVAGARGRGVVSALSVASFVGVLAVILATGDAQSQVNADRSDFIPRATVIEIMDSMVMSTADVLWNAVAVAATENGIVETVPETDEDWARLRWAAVTMAEAMNSLVIPGRHVAPAGAVLDPNDPSLRPEQIEALIQKNWAVWVGFSHALDAAALEAINAIDARDVDKLSEIGGTIDAACESCHLQFWYPETQ